MKLDKMKKRNEAKVYKGIYESSAERDMKEFKMYVEIKA